MKTEVYPTANRFLELRADMVILELEKTTHIPEQERIKFASLLRDLLYSVQIRESLTPDERKQKAENWRVPYEEFFHSHYEYWYSVWGPLADLMWAALSLLWHEEGTDLLRCPSCGHSSPRLVCEQNEDGVACGFRYSENGGVPDEVLWASNAWSSGYSEMAGDARSRHSGEGIGGANPCG